MTQLFKKTIPFLIAFAVTVPSAFGQSYDVTFTNEGNSDFFFTPLWFGLHDGSFDTFDAGAAASASLELLAEDGDVSGLVSDFASVTGGIGGVAANAAGFGGAPVIDPGESAVVTVSGLDAIANRYLSFASMVIPSNDSFIGNANATAYEIFDGAGNFTGPVTIQIFANDIWDAGTEVNDTMGAPFSAVGGVATDEGGTIALLPAGGLDNFAGTGIPTGGTIADLIAADQLVATITVTQSVPEPNGLAMIGFGAIALGAIRRRRK